MTYIFKSSLTGMVLYIKDFKPLETPGTFKPFYRKATEVEAIAILNKLNHEN